MSDDSDHVARKKESALISKRKIISQPFQVTSSIKADFLSAKRVETVETNYKPKSDKLAIDDLTTTSENVIHDIDQGSLIEATKSFTYNPTIYGCRSVDEYQRISFISQGTYGLVYKARCLMTDNIVALKEVKLTSDARKVGFPVTALREINILLALRHPNIIRVREVVVGSTLDKIYMVMDFYDNDLRTCMDMSKQSFSTAEVKQLLLQLLSGINHMHQLWYLHRDLKTSNILYSNTGTLCICDFGLARKYGR